MMTRFFQSVRSSPGMWLFHVIALTLLTGSMMRKSGGCLTTANAKFGIVSFELAFTHETASTIKIEWLTLQCGDMPVMWSAKSNIFKDNFFIIAYTLLFSVSVALVSRKDFAYSRLFVVAAILAGMLDAIENIFMLQYLDGNEIHPMLFGIAASLKFTILTFLFLYVVFAIARRLYEKFARPVAG
jgi:hypothetical protein